VKKKTGKFSSGEEYKSHGHFITKISRYQDKTTCSFNLQHGKVLGLSRVPEVSHFQSLAYALE